MTPPLFGRDEDLAEVARAGRRARLVSIVGAGGIGKTRSHWPRRVLRGAIPGRRWWVELAPLTDGSAGRGEIAGTLGMQPRTGPPAGGSARHGARGRRLLLVLDNCEHLLEAIARWWTVVSRAPGVRILVTSQELLKAATSRSIGSALAVPERESRMPRFGAVALFVERAHAADPRFR